VLYEILRGKTVHRADYVSSVEENIFLGGPCVTRTRIWLRDRGSNGTILPIVFAEKSGANGIARS
jgi:hypothetical protein